MRPFLAVPLLSVLACSLDARDLTAFQDTASGPDKLRAILRSSDRSPSLRAQAALSLFDLPRKDVDGRALLFAELTTLDARGRQVIVPTFQAGLLQRMRTERGKAPGEDAVEAKDAGVKLLGMLGQRERAELGGALLRWIADDVPRRAQSGHYSLEAVARQVGPDSARTLVTSLSSLHDPRSLSRIAAIIDAQAEPDVRTNAAQRLVDLERSYRLRTEGENPAELFEYILPALGRFADQRVVRSRLIALAGTPGVALTEQKRVLELLQGHTTPAELPELLALAQSEQAAPELRVLALSRVGETHSREALPTLLTLLTDRNHAALRRRAGELSLEIGGPEVLSSFFRNLPTGWGMTFDRHEIDAYAERIATLQADNALLLLLGEKLHSTFWWNRVLALRFFASRGTAEDVWRIRQHLYDSQPILGAGWPRGYTVGQEAESALNLALERLHSGVARAPLPQPATNE